jgi:hypothetical protein
MAMDLLRELAAVSLPATFRTSVEVDKIKLLRAAGLVIALPPASSLSLPGSDDAAQVLAITEKGREELGRFCLPGEVPPGRPARGSWWRLGKGNAADRSRPAS